MKSLGFESASLVIYRTPFRWQVEYHLKSFLPPMIVCYFFMFILYPLFKKLHFFWQLKGMPVITNGLMHHQKDLWQGNYKITFRIDNSNDSNNISQIELRPLITWAEVKTLRAAPPTRQRRPPPSGQPYHNRFAGVDPTLRLAKRSTSQTVTKLAITPHRQPPMVESRHQKDKQIIFHKIQDRCQGPSRLITYSLQSFPLNLTFHVRFNLTKTQKTFPLRAQIVTYPITNPNWTDLNWFK